MIPGSQQGRGEAEEEVWVMQHEKDSLFLWALTMKEASFEPKDEAALLMLARRERQGYHFSEVSRNEHKPFYHLGFSQDF